MGDATGFRFRGMGKLARIDTFTTKNGKQILTLIFHKDGQWPQWIPIKVFGRLAEFATEWKPGDILEVTGELGGRDFNGKVYGDATARTVEVVSSGEKQTEIKSDPEPSDDEQNLPF